jgi:hypothetical protein
MPEGGPCSRRLWRIKTCAFPKQKDEGDDDNGGCAAPRECLESQTWEFRLLDDISCHDPVVCTTAS